MKTFAVATDLTPHANRAADFAIQLAHAQQASLVLMNAFHYWPTNPVETVEDALLGAQSLQDANQRALRHLANELHNHYGSDVPIRCVAKEGNLIPTIREVVQAEKIDLLLMSTAGSTPFSAQPMGQVATEMVPETPVPLLLIPPSAEYAAIKNIVLSLDLDTPPDAVVFDTALRFARQLGCVLNVLCIHEQPTDAAVRGRAEHIRHLMATIPHTLTILPGKEVYDILLVFAHTNKADLIMMLPQAHSWLWPLFGEGETQRMARLTDIPLLVVI